MRHWQRVDSNLSAQLHDYDNMADHLKDLSFVPNQPVMVSSIWSHQWRDCNSKACHWQDQSTGPTRPAMAAYLLDWDGHPRQHRRHLVGQHRQTQEVLLRSQQGHVASGEDQPGQVHSLAVQAPHGQGQDSQVVESHVVEEHRS